MNVLIAAEQILNEFIIDALGNSDVQVTTVEPAFKTENVLNALRQKEYDLVILTNSDYSAHELPDLAAQTKSNYPSIKIIVATGYESTEIVNALAAIGIDAFMKLPMKKIELQLVVHNTLQLLPVMSQKI